MADSDKMIKPGVGEALTEREREILACLVEGLSNAEIAGRLHLALKTVKWYNSQIYSKLGVTNRQRAIEKMRALEEVENPNAPATTRHNLPVQMTPFVGRTVELAEIRRLLADPVVKLVTILAPGGMGKTRLALEAAREQLSHFADGVFFVPLVAARSAEDMVTSIAENIGFTLFGDAEPRQQLLNYFHERNTLLILDNFEHLLDCATLVANLIQVAPNVKVLVTSREKLNLSGEMVLTLSGLEFSDGSRAEAVLDFDAARLFMQSVHQARGQLEMQADDLKSVAHICRLTAGMPLALVLAAGWLDVLTLEQIAAEIQQGIDILETEMRDVPERQRSVRATLNTSWERLTDVEQNAFMKLAVFRGGFTSDAAQIIANANIRLLRVLAGKALIQTLPNGRYDIHELLRQYTEEKLTGTGAADKSYQIHCAYFADFMQQRADDVKGRRQIGALNEVEADFNNIRAAWAWAIRQGDAVSLDKMMETLYLFSDMRTRYRDGEILFAQAVREWTPQPGQEWIWQRLRAREAAMWVLQGEKFVDSHDQLESCLQAAQARGDQVEVAFCLFLLGEVTEFLNEPERALQLYHQSHDLFSNLGDPFYTARVLRPLTHIHCSQPRKYVELHLRLCQRLLELTREIGDRTGMAHAILYLSISASYRGDYDEVRRLRDEAEAIWSETGDRKSVAIVRNATASDLFSSGEFERAENMAEENLVVGVDINFRNIRRGALVVLSRIAAMREDYHRAQVLAYNVRAAELLLAYFPAFLEASMAEVGLLNFAAARRLLHEGMGNAFHFIHKRDMVAFLPIAAVVLAHEGQAARAAEVLGLAFSHPRDLVGWMEKWPLLGRLRADLEVELGAEVYRAAWERGAGMDLDIVVEGLLAELGESGS